MKLILVGGSLATGKSTISKMIAQQTGFQRVAMDEIKEALFDAGGYKDRAWSKEIGLLAWPAFQRLIEMRLERGESVIADATFLWSTDADWVHHLAQTHTSDVIQIWLTADPAMARTRFVARARNERHPGHGDTLEVVMEDFDKRFFNKGILSSPLSIPGRTLIVDTTDFASVDYEQILDFIRATPDT